MVFLRYLSLFLLIKVLFFEKGEYLWRPLIFVPYIFKLKNVVIIMIHFFCEKYFKQ